MSSQMMLRFKELGKSGNEIYDLPDDIEVLDSISMNLGIEPISSFIVHIGNIETPEDLNWENEDDVKEFYNLAEPWFEISDGLDVIQALIAAIEKAEDEELSGNEELTASVEDLKVFEEELNNRLEDSQQFRIEWF